MKRRIFLCVLVAIPGLLALAPAVFGEPRKMPLIGFLGLASTSFTGAPIAAFHEGLQGQGGVASQFADKSSGMMVMATLTA